MWLVVLDDLLVRVSSYRQTLVIYEGRHLPDKGLSLRLVILVPCKPNKVERLETVLHENIVVQVSWKSMKVQAKWGNPLSYATEIVIEMQHIPLSKVPTDVLDYSI